MKVTTSLRLDEELLEWVGRIAKSRRQSTERTKTWVIEKCLTEYLPVLDPKGEHRPKRR